MGGVTSELLGNSEGPIEIPAMPQEKVLVEGKSRKTALKNCLWLRALQFQSKRKMSPYLHRLLPGSLEREFWIQGLLQRRPGECFKAGLPHNLGQASLEQVKFSTGGLLVAKNVLTVPLDDL